jgi:hypothetical protein
MLVRILVTVLVIVLAVVYLRKRRQRQAQSRQPAASAMPVPAADPAALEQFLDKARQNTGQAAAAGAQFRMIVGILAMVVLTGGGIYSYLYWQEQQRLVTVLLHRDASQPPVIYRVARRNLGEGSFVTEDGTRVTVSANERMEVVGL